MKMKFLKASVVCLALALSLIFSACGRKDGDIQADIEKQKTNLNMEGITASVKDGIVTLTGVSQDDAGKAAVQSSIAGIKGVKSVVNNITVAPPPPPVAPVEIAADDPLTKGVTDATKDYPGVKAEVQEGVITLTGDIQRKDLQKLMMTLHSLKPKKIDNKLTIK